MNKLTVVLSLFVCSILIQPSLSAKAKEKNPFASYFMKIERNEKKISKMDAKKDKKKITSYKEKVSKDRKKLSQIVDKKTEEIDKKIEKLEARLEREKEAGKDVTLIKKQLHDQNNLLTKINAWAKNEDPPELEKFSVETKTTSGKSGGATSNDGGTTKDDDEFDPEAFRKSMETDDTKKEEPAPAKKKKPTGPKKRQWSWYGDTDKDGKVSEEEWHKKRKQTAKKDKKPYVEAEQKEAFKKLDKNSDGSIFKNEKPK